MYTLGTTSKTVVKLAESYSLNIGVVATAVLGRGTLVKLGSNGEVTAVAAVTDEVFGTVVAGNREAGMEVTVQTKFNAVLRGVADGAVTTGQKLACSGVQSAGEKLNQFKTAVATNVVCAIALSDAADGEDVQVGILRATEILSA